MRSGFFYFSAGALLPAAFIMPKNGCLLAARIRLAGAVTECDPLSSAPKLRSSWVRLGWLAGLPVLGLAWAGATFVTAPYVATALEQETAAVLQVTGKGAPWLRLEIRGRDLFASGEGPEPNAREAILNRLATIDGVRRLIDRTGPGAQISARPDDSVKFAPPVEPAFSFVVERRPDGGFSLSGEAASEAAHARMRKSAADLAEGAPVEDGLRARRELPESGTAEAAAAFAVQLAGLLHEGSVRYEAAALAVSGNALDAEAAAEIETLMRETRPAGIGAGPVAVTAHPVSPYRVRIRREADAVVLSGHLPDLASRESVLAALRPRIFDTAIRDRTRLSQGAPPALADALRAAIVPLTLLASGEIVVSDRNLRLSGESLYPESARRLNDTGLSALPPGWTSTASVTTRDPATVFDAPTCTRLFAERITGKTLRFSPGSSELKPDFYPLLDALADLSGKCREATLVVTGHGDPPGTPAPKPIPLPEAQGIETGTIARHAAGKPAKDSAKDQAKKAEAAASKTKPAATAKTSKTAETTRPAVAAKAVATDPAKPDSGKPEPIMAEPVPEPEPDLPRARALAIVDYLQKAGVAHVSVAPDGAPLTERQGIGFALRS